MRRLFVVLFMFIVSCGVVTDNDFDFNGGTGGSTTLTVNNQSTISISWVAIDDDNNGIMFFNNGGAIEPGHSSTITVSSVFSPVFFEFTGYTGTFYATEEYVSVFEGENVTFTFRDSTQCYALSSGMSLLISEGVSLLTN